MAYVMLAAVGILTAVLTWRRERLAVHFALLVMTGAAIDIADLGAILFRLYDYRPGLLAHPVRDARLGTLLADYLFVPLMISGLMGAAWRFRMAVGLGLAALFAGVEVLFVRQGIFVLQGWSTWYSLGLFGVLTVALGLWVGKFAHEGYTPFHRVIILLTTLHYIWAGLALFLSGVLNLYTFRPHLLALPGLDNVLGGIVLQLLPFMAICGISIWKRWQESPASAAVTGFLWAAAVWGETAWGVRQNAWSWGPLQGGLTMALVVWAAASLDRWLADESRAGVRI